MDVIGVGSPALWGGFLAGVLVLLALDLGLFHRRPHAVGLREALGWSAVWVALAGLFNVWVWMRFGSGRGLEFTTGYLIEKALSVDNLFVFAVVFRYFAVPAAFQHRILFWGILGALVLRGVFIAVGGAMLAHFHWTIYLFGGLLVLTGVKLFRQREEPVSPADNPMVRLVRRLLPVTDGHRGSAFLVREGGRRVATPLLLALVVVEATDVLFAIDSIPAVFAVTRDPFLVFTSNVFAILGLRSLYFLLAGSLDRFHHLKTGLAFILVFVGLKMLAQDLWKIPVAASLGIIAAVLAASLAASLARPRAAAGTADYSNGPSSAPVAPQAENT